MRPAGRQLDTPSLHYLAKRSIRALQAEMSWVHCFKFEILSTLEMLWFKSNSIINIYNANNNKMRKVIFDALKYSGVFCSIHSSSRLIVVHLQNANAKFHKVV